MPASDDIRTEWSLKPISEPGTDRTAARLARGRVRDWTRERFQLDDDTTVLVTEVACGLPGCPPIETVVAFWSEGEARSQFKVFKPIAAVACDDLPPRWMKPSLVVVEGEGCDCC